jgi:hypothetical protein
MRQLKLFPRHNHSGNCWQKAYECKKGCGKGNLCDVCHMHDNPRGECDECPPCEACEKERRGK